MSDSLLGGGNAPIDTPPVDDSGATGGSQVPEWLSGIEGIDTEIVGDPSLKAINDVPSLIKSYVNAQKLIGADKVVIPKADAPQEDWNNFYAKMGKPSSLEEFKVEPIENGAIEQEFTDAFKQAAFEANLLPHQAQKLLAAMNDYEAQANEAFVAQSKEKFEAAVTELKGEWGDAFESKVKMANDLARDFGGQELLDHLKNTGIGADPMIVKAFVKMAEQMKGEDGTVGKNRPTGGVLTPDEAKQKYLAIMDDANDVYHHADRAGHKARVDEVTKLFEAMG